MASLLDEDNREGRKKKTLGHVFSRWWTSTQPSQIAVEIAAVKLGSSQPGFPKQKHLDFIVDIFKAHNFGEPEIAVAAFLSNTEWKTNNISAYKVLVSVLYFFIHIPGKFIKAFDEIIFLLDSFELHATERGVQVLAAFAQYLKNKVQTLHGDSASRKLVKMVSVSVTVSDTIATISRVLTCHQNLIVLSNKLVAASAGGKSVLSSGEVLTLQAAVPLLLQEHATCLDELTILFKEVYTERNANTEGSGVVDDEETLDSVGARPLSGGLTGGSGGMARGRDRDREGIAAMGALRSVFDEQFQDVLSVHRACAGIEALDGKGTGLGVGVGMSRVNPLAHFSN